MVAPDPFTRRPIRADPLAEVITLLHPVAIARGGLVARGRWGMSFRAKNDLLFCMVERGGCERLTLDQAPLTLAAGDFLLIRARRPFVLASDRTALPADSDMLAATHGPHFTIGDGDAPETRLRAGRILLDTNDWDLLAGLIPSEVLIEAGSRSLMRVRSLLAMMEDEADHLDVSRDFMLSRLAELLLVEVLRSCHRGTRPHEAGLLTGLADPAVGRTLKAMHAKVAYDWSVEALARLCAMSRSSFAARFRRIVGTGPIGYLLGWRMALAKEALRRNESSISEIAAAIGFQSTSAFSSAFARAVGCPPSRFAQNRSFGTAAADRRSGA